MQVSLLGRVTRRLSTRLVINYIRFSGSALLTVGSVQQSDCNAYLNVYDTN